MAAHPRHHHHVVATHPQRNGGVNTRRRILHCIALHQQRRASSLSLSVSLSLNNAAAAVTSRFLHTELVRCLHQRRDTRVDISDSTRRRLLNDGKWAGGHARGCHNGVFIALYHRDDERYHTHTHTHTHEHTNS